MYSAQCTPAIEQMFSPIVPVLAAIVWVITLAMYRIFEEANVLFAGIGHRRVAEKA